MSKRVTIGIILGCGVLVFSGCSHDEKTAKKNETIRHLSSSMEYDNKATAIINKGYAFTRMSSQDSEKMIEFLKRAAEEARQVNVNLLNSEYPEWGTRFQMEYVEGLSLMIKGLETGNMQYSIEGQQKMSAYKDWFNKIKKRIKKP